MSAIEIAHTFSLAEHHDGFRQVVAQDVLPQNKIEPKGVDASKLIEL